MNILIIDIEATCGRIIPHDQMETIEIGAVILDKIGIMSEYQAFVKPVLNPILSDFCKELTGILQRDVDGAQEFGAAWETFTEWIPTSTTHWASWGDFDKRVLLDDCRRANIAYTLPIEHINLAKVFQDITGRKRGNRGAAKYYGIKPDGPIHRGLSDAKNIAKVYQRMQKVIQFRENHKII